MSKVNRWEAPEWFVAIENVGVWFDCAGCQAVQLNGYCNFSSTKQAMCHCNYRKDGKVVTLREANKHYFIHTGRDECPKWLIKLAEEHPEWRLYCWYNDGSTDRYVPNCEADELYSLMYAQNTLWDEVKYFQIIPV